MIQHSIKFKIYPIFLGVEGISKLSINLAKLNHIYSSYINQNVCVYCYVIKAARENVCSLLSLESWKLEAV